MRQYYENETDFVVGDSEGDKMFSNSQMASKHSDGNDFEKQTTAHKEVEIVRDPFQTRDTWFRLLGR